LVGQGVSVNQERAVIVVLGVWNNPQRLVSRADIRKAIGEPAQAPQTAVN
jgi:hypothetical protein